jgi:hypothetical protein
LSGLDRLSACAGNCRGTNMLQDPHSGKPDESPSALSVTPVLGGRFVRVEYTWGYGGEPQEGSLLVGLDPKSGEASGHWVDTWHMGRKAMTCLGTATDEGSISMKGSYAAPLGPDRGWRIEIAPEGDALRISHMNIDPDGKKEPAAVGVYSRA